MLGLGNTVSTSDSPEGSSEALVVTTEAATSVGDSTAQINGSYTGGSGVSQCGFEFGIDSSLSIFITLSVSGPSPSFFLVTPLLHEDQTYYYRAFVKDSSGITRGSILSFTTTGTEPALPNLPDPIPVYSPNWSKGTALDSNLDFWTPYFQHFHEPLEVLGSVTDEFNTTKNNVVRIQRKVSETTPANSIALALFENNYSQDTENQFSIEAGATYRITFDAFIPSTNRSTETGSIVKLGSQDTNQWYFGTYGYTSSDTGRWKTVRVDLNIPDPLASGNNDLIISAENDDSSEKEDKFFIANLLMSKV